LHYDASSVEAVACLAAHAFYADQPEVALKHYRRLLQSGVQSMELWNNLGLSCFFASQYDMTLTCFERALALAPDDTAAADVWYNVGHVAVGIGDLTLAYQAFKVATSLNATHAESFANVGVLELRKGNVEAARASFTTAQALAPHMYEPFFNGALLAYKLGDFQEAFSLVEKSLAAFPGHTESVELHKALRTQFALL
jgi:tetratricopeptide repeat protein 8